MNHSIESLTTATLSLALSAASQRHQAIAANLANASAPGYQPLRLAFETQLADARQALGERGTVAPRHLDAIRPALEPDVDAHGRAVPVQLDASMVELARNAVHYQALAQGLSRHLAIQALAVADGRR